MGYVKLLLINRRVRIHELDDVEKRMRLEKIRQTGQLADRREEDPIPFGIRALDSGVEIDGIWISRESTPVPEGKRIGRYVKRKSEASESIKSSHSFQSLQSLQVPSIGKTGRRTFSNGYGFRVSSPNTEYVPTFDVGDEGACTGKARSTYKPVRSSGLRYSSYNGVEHDPGTLGQLEGNIAVKDGVNWHRPTGGPPNHSGASSPSGSFAENADNERSSGSSARSAIPTVQVTRPSSPYQYEPTQVQQGGYNRMDMPESAGPSNPFMTPEHALLLSNASSRSVHTPDTFHTAVESALEAELLLLSPDSRSGSPERPHVAFQHTNQDTRHVNSGFSIFPAGALSTVSKGKEAEHPATRDSQSPESSEQKKPNKLRKKPRFSWSGRSNSKEAK